MKVCFFGTYNHNYARNSTLGEGLRSCGVHVVEINTQLTNERMELPEDFTFKTTIHRIWRKLITYIKLLDTLYHLIKNLIMKILLNILF